MAGQSPASGRLKLVMKDVYIEPLVILHLLMKIPYRKNVKKTSLFYKSKRQGEYKDELERNAMDQRA